MVYITGDTHGDFYRIFDFCEKNKTTTDDIMIILGDVGINYYGGKKDIILKEKLYQLPITLFCIKGNHENYAGNIPSYKIQEAFRGLVLVEDKYPNLLFAIDGEVYSFEVDGEYIDALVIGGAYSVDKYYRLQNGYKWWEDEQPSDVVKSDINAYLAKGNNIFDIILTHTCPLRYEPTEWFLPFIDSSTVDKTTEIWLDEIYDKMSFSKWLCGHYHGEKKIDKMEFMFLNIKKLEV